MTPRRGERLRGRKLRQQMGDSCRLACSWQVERARLGVRITGQSSQPGKPSLVYRLTLSGIFAFG